MAMVSLLGFCGFRGRCLGSEGTTAIRRWSDGGQRALSVEKCKKHIPVALAPTDARTSQT